MISNNKIFRKIFILAVSLVMITILLAPVQSGHALQFHYGAGEVIKDKLSDKKEKRVDNIREIKHNLLGACCPLCGC
jgi:hypothetical protein